MRLTFHGAAGGQVTGSMHLLEAAGARVLLDAGLFQGRRAETRKLNAELPFDARRIDAVVVSHAHIDHTGRLPLLVKEGFHSPIIATPATRDLSAVMLPDAAHIQESDFEFLKRHERVGPEAEPLYNMADAVAVQDLMEAVPYNRPHHIRKHLVTTFIDAGHILGSASVDIRITENGGHRLVFSGDIGRNGLPIIRDPVPPSGAIDTLIIESTYGNREHESIADAEERLGEIVRRAAGARRQGADPGLRGGPHPGAGVRAPLALATGKIPGVPIYVDSPLAVNATEVFRLHPEIFDQREQLIERAKALFDFQLVRYVRDAAESKALNTMNGPAVIIAASGMAEAGRILHHLRNGIGSHKNIVLFVGFQGEHTLGRRIQEGATEVKIFGEMFPVAAEIETIGGYSAHADRNELRAWVRKIGGPMRRAFVVHGETPAREAMAKILKEEGVKDVVLPALGQGFDL